MITLAGVEDKVLVRKAVCGDRDAFSTLVDRYRSAAYGVALHYLGCREDAQDAAQEAFVRAYLGLRQLREPDRFGPWLRRITANTCTNILRSGRRDVSLDLVEESAPIQAAPHPDSDPDQVPFRLVINDALGHLPEPARLTILLFYIDGYSQAEIARFLEVPVSTINSRLEHARRRLRKELRSMVTDALQEGKPGQEFTRRVVEEALRRGDGLMRRQYHSDALREYARALEQLDQLEPGKEQKRLRVSALTKSGLASIYLTRHDRANTAIQQALGLSEELHDRKEWLDLLGGLAATTRELMLYQVDDRGRFAGELMARLDGLRRSDVTATRAYCTEALPLFERMGMLDWMAVCQAALDLLEEIDGRPVSSLVVYNLSCGVLDRQGGVTKLVADPGYSEFSWDDEAVTALLEVGGLLAQISPLGKFLDSSVPVGGGWSGASRSASRQPLYTTVQVRSDSERVVVPAGSFTDCLLIEQVTREGPEESSDGELDSPERYHYPTSCGTQQAWWAPGVGLVQLQVAVKGEVEALFQLEKFSVESGGSGYFPLARGNSWRYGWANVSEEYVATEVYRVTGALQSRSMERYFLENYSLLYRRDS